MFIDCILKYKIILYVIVNKNININKEPKKEINTEIRIVVIYIYRSIVLEGLMGHKHNRTITIKFYAIIGISC